MCRTSQPGPGVDVGAACTEEVSTKPRAQSASSRLSPIPSPSLPPLQHKGSMRLKQTLVASIQSTLQKNFLILCVQIKVQM